MRGHTPGPWTWDGRYTVCIPHAKGETCFRSNPEDARLIVAAPDLACSADAFLRWFRVFIGDATYNEIRADELDALRAALAKAGVCDRTSPLAR